MTSLAAFGNRVAEGISRRSYSARKYFRQQVRALRTREPKRILFILGCQRSGTTLVQQIFDADLDAWVFGEYSEISGPAKKKRIRLRPLPEVKRVFDRTPARLIVAKPIVETQNALKLLDFFEGSKAIFVFRHFASVASSNLKQFGPRNGINNLRAIVNDEEDNWRCQGVPADVRALVRRHFDEDMNPWDAAALFWYVRNRFYFDLGLDRHPAVMPFRYESLVRDPMGTIEPVYRFVGMPVCTAAAALVHAQSVEKGRDIDLSPEIRKLCQGLLDRLVASYESIRELRATPAPRLATGPG